MIVEKPQPVDVGLSIARGFGLVLGAAIPLVTATLYDAGIAKEMARQTALQADSRCRTHGPWTGSCRQASAEVAASRVAGWTGRE